MTNLKLEESRLCPFILREPGKKYLRTLSSRIIAIWSAAKPDPLSPERHCIQCNPLHLAAALSLCSTLLTRWRCALKIM